MIIKSLLIFSILSAFLSQPYFENKFNRALHSIESGKEKTVSAYDNNLVLPSLVKIPKINKFSKRVNIYSHNYLLGDLDSGRVILKKDNKSKVPIASTTKIMTAIVVLENYNLSEVVTISYQAAFQPGADTFLRVGEEIKVRELLYCLLLKSGNDSAYALAEHFSKNNGIDAFIELMNKKAEELNMNDSKYLDPAGLNTEGFSTANDQFKLARYVLNNKEFVRIVSTSQYIAKSTDGALNHHLKNSNRLISDYNYVGAIGIKTGYMPEAGHCLISAAEREGHTLIGIVLKTYADTIFASADESKKLLDWGFQNIIW